jgi:hypothetical protein
MAKGEVDSHRFHFAALGHAVHPMPLAAGMHDQQIAVSQWDRCALGLITAMSEQKVSR